MAATEIPPGAGLGDMGQASGRTFDEELGSGAKWDNVRPTISVL